MSMPAFFYKGFNFLLIIAWRKQNGCHGVPEKEILTGNKTGRDVTANPY
jgi:hypothetical protein